MTSTDTLKTVFTNNANELGRVKTSLVADALGETTQRVIALAKNASIKPTNKHGEAHDGSKTPMYWTFQQIIDIDLQRVVEARQDKTLGHIVRRLETQLMHKNDTIARASRALQDTNGWSIIRRKKALNELHKILG